ncbi:MAG: Rpn family recombination-promoting nuclease/putative transposase, partial [bacterium]|nr:Rpn family recombination-promoting nuclease/putative transposase [bacterium]
MDKIDKINDKLFKDVFKIVENARTLLKKVLPDAIKSRLNFSTLALDSTDHT